MVVTQKEILDLAKAVGHSYTSPKGNGVTVRFNPDGSIGVNQLINHKRLFVASTRKDITIKPAEGVDLEEVAKLLEALIDPKSPTATPAADPPGA